MAPALKLHVLDQLYRHSSNVAHGVEVPAGARLLFTNGQVGTRPDGVTPGTTAEQTEVAFERLRAVLQAAGMGFADVVRFDVYFTDRADVLAAVGVDEHARVAVDVFRARREHPETAQRVYPTHIEVFEERQRAGTAHGGGAGECQGSGD